MNQSEIKHHILEVLNQAVTAFNPENALLKQMNSLQFVQVIHRLEQAFSIQFHVAEYDEKYFESLDNLLQLVERKLQPQVR